MAQTQPQWPVPDPLPSCWIAETQPLDDFRSSDDLPSAADVVIIGSGFAGVATAYHLLNDNPDPPSIVLLEARKICSGATGRNGGHIKPDLFYTAAKHANMYGAAEAAEIAAFETANLYAVKDLVELEQIDCDFHLTRGLDVFLDPEHAKDTEETYRRLVESGVVNLRDVAFTPKDQAERVSFPLRMNRLTVRYPVSAAHSAASHSPQGTSGRPNSSTRYSAVLSQTRVWSYMRTRPYLP